MGEKHSNVVGGSTAARRLGCPGSMSLEATMPDETSVYAQEGTDLHELMEKLFDDEEPDTETFYLGEQHGSIAAVTQEQADALKWCYERVDPVVGQNEFVLEMWGDFPGIKGAGGTCDVVVLHDDDTATIMDYKFGRGVPVSAEDNKQLMFYACCVRAKFPHLQVIYAHILQPRLDSHTSVVLPAHELDNFERTLRHAIANAREEYHIGPWCKFCKAESICPAKMEMAQAAYLWDVNSNSLARSLAIVDEVEQWAASVRAAAHAALDHGANIQGWKLVNKRATRKWVLTESAIHRRLQRAGLKLDQRAPRKLITPAQAEKLGVVLKEDMVESKSSGTTLARESDNRPAIDRGRRSLNDLAMSIKNGIDGEEDAKK